MTYREKLEQEHPKEVNPKYQGGCLACPGVNWAGAPLCGGKDCLNAKQDRGDAGCRDCWGQEAPESLEPLTSKPPNCGSAAQTETPTYRRMSEPPKPTPPKRRKLVYIAGPITGVAKYWEPFEEMAEEVRAAGYIPLIPTWQPEGLTNAQYMRMCMAMLDAADAVLLLPGWRDSIGATIEAAYAAYVEKPIFESIEELREVIGE